MNLNLNNKNNPFTPEGFSVFLKRDVPVTLLIMLIFLLFFSLFCRQTWLMAPVGKQLAWASREVAMIHGFSISLAAALFLAHRISVDSWCFMMNLTRGFLLADIFMMLRYPAITSNGSLLAYIGHHIFLLGVTLHIHKVPRQIALGFVEEVSLIPLYFSWYMVKWGRKKEPIFMIIAIITLIAYFTRIVVFTYLFTINWRSYRFEKNKEAFNRLLVGIPILLLNYMWFYKLLQNAYEQLL